MSMKTVIPLTVALILGVVAAKLGKDMMGRNRTVAGPNMKTTRLVIANEDLAPGTTIKETDVALKELPADSGTQFTFSTPKDVVGRVVTTQLVKGQTVMDTLLAPVGSNGPGALVPAGMRAVTVEVNEFSGVAGLLVPGSRVDVVQTIHVKADDSMMAKTIVENLKILAVGRRLGTMPANPGEPEAIARSVTLLATAEQAEAIDLASHVGNPRLVLRNSKDEKLGAGKGVTVATLRGNAGSGESDPINDMFSKMLLNQPATKPVTPTAKAEAPAPKFREVEIIRGGASTSVRVGLRQDNTLTDVEKLLGETPER